MRRILIVGADILNQQNAAGITLRSIFDGIDEKYLMGITVGNKASCGQQYPINMINVHYCFFSAGSILDHPCIKEASKRAKMAEKVSSSSFRESTNHSGARRVLKSIRQRIALMPASSRIRFRKKEFDVINQFNPQVIYTVGESVSRLKLSYDLSNKLNIPIVIHFMDNWKKCIEWASNPLLTRYQKKLGYYCDLCYSRSTECIAIGERMADAYMKESGVKHSVIMNSIDTSSYYCEPKASVGKVQFLYAGGLHLGRDEALRKIGKCIDYACRETGKQAEFLIYTSEDNIALYADEFKSLEHTKLVTAVPHERIRELYRKADVLVHVESSALTSNEFFKYSVSTKISEYLATGRPFLFWGPKGIYLLDLLRENKLAYTASCIEEAQHIVLEMMNDCHNEYSENALKYAENNFDIAVAQERFRQVIDNVHICGK